jgi:hypothetical protein
VEQSIAFSCRVLSDGNRKVNLIQHPESHSRSHFIESFDALQVLGIIEDERPGGMIPMAELKHDIVSEGAPERRQRRHFCVERLTAGGLVIQRAARAPMVTAIRRRLSDPLLRFRSLDEAQRTSLLGTSMD